MIFSLCSINLSSIFLALVLDSYHVFLAFQGLETVKELSLDDHLDLQVPCHSFYGDSWD
jgi:hypothetical protein